MLLPSPKVFSPPSIFQSTTLFLFHSGLKLSEMTPKSHFTTCFLKEIGVLRNFSIEKSLKIVKIGQLNLKHHLARFFKHCLLSLFLFLAFNKCIPWFFPRELLLVKATSRGALYYVPANDRKCIEKYFSIYLTSHLKPFNSFSFPK